MAVFDRSKEYEKLKKDVVRANNAISRIEKRYGEDSWGVSRLYNKLDNEMFKGITKSGRIKLNKNMSDIQLKAIQKATHNFLSGKTSTIKGIEGVKKEVNDSIRATYSDIGNNLTNKEVNTLYDLVDDKDKRAIISKDEIPPSDIWTTLVQAKEQGLSKNQFIDLLEKRSQLDIRDEDVLRFLEDMFNKYMVA